MEKQAYISYQRAAKKVKAIRKFYSHLIAFLLVTLGIFVLRFFVLPKMIEFPKEPGFTVMLDLNTYLVPGIWGLIVGIHGLVVHRAYSKWMRNWEKSKLDQLLRAEERRYQNN